jgi:hypothetical protein
MFHEEAMEAKHRRWKTMSGGKKALIIAGWAVLAAAGLALMGLLVMLLWNRILSGVLGLPSLGFWEAIGLFILTKILFGGGRGASMMAKMRMRRIMRERMSEQAGDGEGKRD